MMFQHEKSNTGGQISKLPAHVDAAKRYPRSSSRVSWLKISNRTARYAARPICFTIRTYAIGYRKPPKQHRFQKVKSGKPQGRPKEKKTNLTIVLQDLLADDI
jgi:hypothetical protein